MAMMTMLRNRMHVVLWALLVLFLLSMTVGGLVGGANIIDQLLARVNPADANGLVNGQKITPNQFNQAVNAQMDAIRTSGSQVSDQDLERVRSQVWNGFIEEYLTKEAIEDLDISVSDEEIIYHLENNPPIDIQRLFHSLIYSVDGLKSAVTNQVSFVLEIAIGALLIPIAIWLGQSGLEIALMISVLMLVLIVELINSAIETTVDRIGMDNNVLSKNAKDMGSAAVFLALINVPLVWSLVLFA